MNHFKSHSWENRPKNLNIREIESPFSVLAYYYTEWTHDYENHIEKWQEAVLSYGCYEGVVSGSGEDLLYMYNAVIRISEALFVINDLVGIGHLFPMFTEEEVNLERSKSRWFPKNLSKKERLNPYNAINKIFRNIELQRLREYLWEFLVFALSGKPCDVMFDFEEVNFVFKQIHKLVSISYLIINRDQIDLTIDRVFTF